MWKADARCCPYNGFGFNRVNKIGAPLDTLGGLCHAYFYLLVALLGSWGPFFIITYSRTCALVSIRLILNFNS